LPGADTARIESLSTTSTLGDPGSHAFAVGDGRDMTRAFRLAARHSRRVRRLRVAIPATIMFILTATILVSWLDPLKVLVRFPIDSGKIVISGTKITMEAPKLSGYTKDQRWYEMNAKAAAQDVTKPDLVELVEVRAKIETADKSTIFLSSKDGLYNRKTSFLNLDHNVIVRSTSGFEMHLDEAVIDTANGEVVSNKPVSAFTEDSTLNSDRLEIHKSGEIVHFIDNVVMNIDSVGKQRQPASAPQPTAAKR
jgi:lipopolysaccharide export system protein LptC